MARSERLSKYNELIRIEEPKDHGGGDAYSKFSYIGKNAFKFLK